MSRVILTIALVTAALFATSASALTDLERFTAFKTQYGRKYKNALEESVRFQTFQENLRTAERLQRQNPLASFGVNEFSDVAASDFKRTHHNAEKQMQHRVSIKDQFKTLAPSAADIASAPAAVDWRTKGAVTNVKNQKQCGGCWAFSSTGNIEGQWFLAGNTLTSLSEQNLISCDTTNMGCDGGIMDTAWEWLISAQSGGIATEASYPFVSGDGVAPACTPPTSYASYIDGHYNVETTETAMAAYCAKHGPVSIAVDATSFQTYNGGILTDCISQKVDHAVLIVGYDDSNSPAYWIIKNSWGPGWGESGYIRVQKGTDQCLITTIPCTSTVSSSPPPPGPAPPVPPTPPTPPTPPSTGTFKQYACTDSYCQTCTKTVLNQNTCLKLQGGGSAMAVCSFGSLSLTEYTASADCTGASQPQTFTSGQCYQTQSGGSLEFVCPSADFAERLLAARSAKHGSKKLHASKSNNKARPFL